MANNFVLEKFGSGMHYILLDAATVSALTENNNTRAICRLNDEVEFHCAILPKKEGGHFVNVGSMICKKLNIAEGTTVTATFRVDDTAYQFDMPEAFRAVLSTDPEADNLFHALTPGNQRGLIYLVAQVKSPEKSVERALKIAERLKMGITSPKTILKQK